MAKKPGFSKQSHATLLLHFLWRIFRDQIRVDTSFVFSPTVHIIAKKHCSIPLLYWWNVAKPRIPQPINRHLQIDWNAFKWHTSITREQEVISSSNKEMAFETVWSFWMPFLYCIAKQNKKKTPCLWFFLCFLLVIRGEFYIFASIL